MSVLYCTCLVAVMAVLMATGQSSQVHFVRRFDYDGLFCPLPDMDTTSARTMLVCARKCSKDLQPLSFFYDSASGTCTCLPSVPASEDNCTPSEHSLYFEPQARSRLHSNCINNAECTVTNTECWDGVCECIPGYKWSVNHGFCVADCPNGLGSSFTNGYTGHEVLCTYIQILTTSSVSTCLEGCAQTPNCLAVSYHTPSTDCALRTCTPLTEQFTVMSTINLYVRNCSPP